MDGAGGWERWGGLQCPALRENRWITNTPARISAGKLLTAYVMRTISPLMPHGVPRKVGMPMDMRFTLTNTSTEVGAMMILDEIQPGFGRTGKLFSFEHYDMVPDILVMGKGMGGGVPVGAFMSSAEIMKSLQHSPKLGHITTFGGNPLIAAASYATLKEVLESGLMNEVEDSKDTELLTDFKEEN